jgi:hypothetical protein
VSMLVDAILTYLLVATLCGIFSHKSCQGATLVVFSILNSSNIS